MRKKIIKILRVFSTIITWLIINIPHKKKYYVFSSKYGFSDNSKYLFLYYLEQGHNCVWVSSDRTCYHEVENILKSHPQSKVINKNSLNLLGVLARSKYIFVTHSFFDLGVFVTKSCPIINLWHGIPIKKMGYDSINDKELFKLDLFNPYKLNDFVISSSNITKPFLTSCMDISQSKVLPLGQPRNDFLYNNMTNSLLINKLKSYYSEESEARVFLYAPTFRDNSNYSLKTYTKLIHSFAVNSIKTDNLILRLHPKERELLANIKLPRNVKLSLIPDVQEELLAADVLISDYSSIIFDFSILARPIILYTPDKEIYFSNRGGSYFEYDDIIQECIHIKDSELDSTWCSELKNTDLTRLVKLHSVFSCEAIYKRFS